MFVGSHLDSQPQVGRFDGTYGVLVAAHVVERLLSHGTEQPGGARVNLAVVNWFNEEGSRFKPSMQGSGVFTGKIDLDAALSTADAAGISVRAMQHRQRMRMGRRQRQSYVVGHIVPSRCL